MNAQLFPGATTRRSRWHLLPLLASLAASVAVATVDTMSLLAIRMRHTMLPSSQRTRRGNNKYISYRNDQTFYQINNQLVGYNVMARRWNIGIYGWRSWLIPDTWIRMSVCVLQFDIVESRIARLQ